MTDLVQRLRSQIVQDGDGAFVAEIDALANEAADRIEALEAALRDFCLSAECASACDEWVTSEQAYSEILSFTGSALAVSYRAARQVLDDGKGE